jgi:hypothetical protein
MAPALPQSADDPRGFAADYPRGFALRPAPSSPPYDLPAELKSQTLKRMKPATDASESVK